MQTNRSRLEETLSDDCKILAKKYKWKLMKAATVWQGPQRDKPGSNWRRLVVAAYKYVATCRALAREESFRELIESVSRRSSEKTRDVQSLDKEKTMYDLFKGSASLLYDEHYEMGLSHYVSTFEDTLAQSVGRAEELVDELYIERCILPAALYISMKYEIEARKAETTGQDVSNPDTLFSIGVRLKENANDIWENAKENARNFDEWLDQLHQLFPLYKLSGSFLLNASGLYETQSNTQKRNSCLQEEYSADEFAADCYAGICAYGRSDHLAVLDIFTALGKGVEHGKRALLFSYASLPRLPGFVYDSMSQFIDQRAGEEGIAELFVREYDKIVERGLDQFSVRLLNEAEIESKEDSSDHTTVSVSQLVNKEILDMICCPACRSEMELVELTRREREERGIDGLLVCRRNRCRKEYPIEYGIVKWGSDEDIMPVQLY